jgi:TATA-box binding protein (TBP) (component of TFIID and TFIIIB)
MTLSSFNTIDDEWSTFLNGDYDEEVSVTSDVDEFNEKVEELNSTVPCQNVPEPTNIYISTKSKIAYLKNPVDLNIFWDIPIIPYSMPQNGVIKKQIKIHSMNKEELEEIDRKLERTLFCEQKIITHIDNPNGRIKFKDTRKITIGISKKDIMSYRSKKKQAFYNCFVMILRINIDNLFREFHIKVFNTGKIEIPGVQSEEMFTIVLKQIIDTLQPHHSYTLEYINKSDTVLINSNFNCRFYINREALCDILKNKYRLQVIYDPCSYPGIQCKFDYNNDTDIQTGINESTANISKVSFMIFRTGSVLIVGKMCDESVVYNIYNFLKNLLKTEFKHICHRVISDDELETKDKKKKIRRKTIQIITELDV